MRIIFFSLFGFLVACQHSSPSLESNSQKADIQNIKSFAGCYAVDFNFTETFPLAEGYQNKKPQHSKGIEYVVVDSEDNNEIQLQHILVSERKGSALKHWRQEWSYEPTQLTSFKGHHEWQTTSVAKAVGAWKQKVNQVDDSPRYECIAKWVNLPQNSYWECQSWNPLPRREYTSRNDYQVMDRLNRQKLTATGWVHEQDSVKLQLLSAQQTKPLVKERGENTYTRIPDEKCKTAQSWWAEHRDNWKSIRWAWSEVAQENPLLKFDFKTEEGELIHKLDEVDDESTQKKLSQDQVRSLAKKTIQQFVAKNHEARNY